MAFDNHVIAVAHELADMARPISKRYFRAAPHVDIKADASPVTAADREIESALRAKIEKEFPEHGIIGEEYGNARGENQYQWVIDPIDGTRAFIAGVPLFTTLIALCRDGVPLLGLIDQPIIGERWLGYGGKTTLYYAQHNAAAELKLSAGRALQEAVIGTTSTDYFAADEARRFETLRSQCAQTIRYGDAYAYGLLAGGSIDLMADTHLKPYDFCALAPVIEGAGGVITDWNGEKLTLQSKGDVLAASSIQIHTQALSVLKS